jgi:hypothetical protein
MDNRLGQFQPLLHAGRVFLELPIAGFPQPDVIEDIMGPLHRLLPGHAGELTEVGREGHGIHSGDQAIVFRHVADMAADPVLLQPDIKAENPSRASLGSQESKEDAEQGTFSGAVRSQKTYGSFAKVQVDAVESLDRAVGEMKIGDFSDHFFSVGVLFNDLFP